MDSLKTTRDQNGVPKNLRVGIRYFTNMVRMQSVVVLRNRQNFKSDLRDIKLRTKCTKRFGTGFFIVPFGRVIVPIMIQKETFIMPVMHIIFIFSLIRHYFVESVSQEGRLRENDNRVESYVSLGCP